MRRRRVNSGSVEDGAVKMRISRTRKVASGTAPSREKEKEKVGSKEDEATSAPKGRITRVTRAQTRT